MKTLSSPLVAHLAAGGPFVMGDLYTIALTSGQVLRWADFDSDITHPGNGYVYSASGPVLKRGKARIVIGVEVDTLDLSVYPRSTDTISGAPILAAAQGGAFDGAMLTLERCFLSGGTPVGVVHLFYGRFADLQLGRTEMQCRINSGTESLQVQLPRNVYQPGCIHTLYDAGCGVSRSSRAIGGTVASGSTTTTINCGLSQAAKYFERGYVKFSGGALDGVRRTVKSYSPGVLGLFSALPSAPTVGADFLAYPGCDRLQATCSGKFANLPNFRGCPFIPVPETAV
jgi:uncharacterized phage protein (TIGR02218 family)